MKRWGLEEYPPEKSNRYKVASRNDGKFNYKLIHNNAVYHEFSGEGGAELLLCKNCQHMFKRRYNEEFNLSDFMGSNKYHGDILGTRKYDFDDVPNVYIDDWGKIAFQQKTARGWQCEGCNIVLADSSVRKFGSSAESVGEIPDLLRERWTPGPAAPGPQNC